MRKLTIGLVGNPNCGKTTLFNALTGSSLKTANWPGVTVKQAEGWLSFGEFQIHLFDLPGIYRLDCSSAEEREAGDWLETEKADVIINVADSSCLERSLALTLQLLQFGKPVVLAVNQFGRREGKNRTSGWDLERLQNLLGGTPCIRISARRKEGLSRLLSAAAAAGRCPERQGRLKNPGIWPGTIEETYKYIEEIRFQCHENTEEASDRTGRIDRWLMHPVWGIPIFLFLMAFVFFLTFAVGNVPKLWFETALGRVSYNVDSILVQTGTAGWLRSLITEGIIPGVGGVLTFLPNMILLFAALSVLEDSGYMARAAYVMNETMGMAGMSGKSFLPLMLGFGCTVPAVMASRIVEDESKRRRTILAAHFMSCPARMTVYVLFSQIFFPAHAFLAACSIYLTGIGAGILTAVIHWKLSEDREEDCLLMELPEYRLPSIRNISCCVWEKTEEYLLKAGTTILLSSVLLWILLHIGAAGTAPRASDSLAASAGRFLAPFFAPAGFGSWQAVTALLSGLFAKEAVVSGFAVVYGIENINSAAGMARLHAQLSASGFGPANAYAFMIFSLLYTSCSAGIAAVQTETKDLKWTFKMAAFQFFTAFFTAAAVYQTGRLLTWLPFSR